MPAPAKEAYNSVKIELRNGIATPIFYKDDVEVSGFTDYEAKRIWDDHPWIRDVVNGLEKETVDADNLRSRYQQIAQAALYYLGLPKLSATERKKEHARLSNDLVNVLSYDE